MDLINSIVRGITSSSIYSLYNPFGKSHTIEMFRYRQMLSIIEGLINNTQKIDQVLSSLGGFFDSNCFIADFFSVVRIKNEQQDLYCTNKIDYINQIRKTSCTTLNSFQWKALSFIANAFGMHQIGYALRTKAIEHIYEVGSDSKNFNAICALFTAAIDQGDQETAKEILFRRIPIRKNVLKKVKRAELLFCMVFGFDINTKTMWYSRNAEDRNFAEFVKGKRVAIVSPGLPKEKPGNEIDSFDLVVRINYKGKNALANREITGSKTNISYYNALTGNKLQSMLDKDFIYDLEYVVQKKAKNTLKMQNVRVRTMRDFASLLFQGSPNMVQRILLDLLMFNAEEIKIFNTNFYLSNNIYYSGYSDTVPGLRSLALHDKTTQINLIRNLWKNEICKVDRECESILLMPNEEIMEEYERLYPR